ncbi:MAG: tol-pal system YbgF family protein [Clostridia bacterium]|jgi:tetratricopeptide (TPR) repeat protein
MNPKDTVAQAKTREEVRLSEKISTIIRANRTFLAVLGISLIIIVVAIGVVSYVQNDRLVKSTLALENLEVELDEWASAENDGKTEKAKIIVASAEKIRSSFPKSYAALRSGVIEASIYIDQGDFSAAETAFSNVALANPKSHLAPTALGNAAAMAEERGDNEKALEYLIKLVDTYPSAPGLGRALFSIGRLYEETRQFDKAVVFYLRLSAMESETDWTKLAQSRIIHLKSLGMVP